MSVLTLADPRVKTLIRRHPLLKTNNIIGFGEFCFVFRTQQPDRVLKLIADPYHTRYLTTKEIARSVFRPKVHRDFGIVGHTLAGVPIRLMEIERLYRLKACTGSYIIAKSIIRFYNTRWASLLPVTKRQLPEASPALLQFMRKLNAYKKATRSSFDLNLQNFMQRSNGRLVFNDPFFDKKALSARTYSCAMRNPALRG